VGGHGLDVVHQDLERSRGIELEDLTRLLVDEDVPSSEEVRVPGLGHLVRPVTLGIMTAQPPLEGPTVSVLLSPVH
jgi:hypothetical protein